MHLVSLHSQCSMGMAGRVWPDGGCLLDQPCLLMDAFAVIGNCKAKAHAKD